MRRSITLGYQHLHQSGSSLAVVAPLTSTLIQFCPPANRHELVYQKNYLPTFLKKFSQLFLTAKIFTKRHIMSLDFPKWLQYLEKTVLLCLKLSVLFPVFFSSNIFNSLPLRKRVIFVRYFKIISFKLCEQHAPLTKRVPGQIHLSPGKEIYNVLPSEANVSSNWKNSDQSYHRIASSEPRGFHSSTSNSTCCYDLWKNGTKLEPQIENEYLVKTFLSMFLSPPKSTTLLSL